MIDDQEFAQQAVVPLGPDRTVEQTVVRELRRLIVDGALRPGARLRYRDLAERFGVSVTPVRNAIRELAKEGLVAMKPHEGARVSPLSREDLEEVYATRMGFESWLVLRGAERLTKRHVVAMRSLFAEAEHATARRDRDSFLRASWAYRCVCFDAAERPKLLAIALTLYDRSSRYQGLTLDVPERFDESLEFLRQLDLACKAGDGRQAASAIVASLERAVEYMIKTLDEAAQ